MTEKEQPPKTENKTAEETAAPAQTETAPLEIPKKKWEKPKFIKSKHKLKSLFLGIAIGTLLTSIFSFNYNIKFIYHASQFAQKTSELFLMERALRNVLSFAIGLYAFSIIIAMLRALNWPKIIGLILLTSGGGLFYLQYLKVPELQRLLESKMTYDSRKRLPPFVNATWEKYVFSNIKKVFNTEVKVSLVIDDTNMWGIQNDLGVVLWKIPLQEDVLENTLTIDSASYYLATKKSIFSGNIITGKKNWTYPAKIVKASNLIVCDKAIYFYCKQCTIKEHDNNGEFYGYVLGINTSSAKVDYVLPIKEEASERKISAPSLYCYKNAIYMYNKETGKFYFIEDKKITVFNSLRDLVTKKETKITEALSMQQESTKGEPIKDVTPFFTGNTILFNTTKWLKAYNLDQNKYVWTYNKGFLTETKSGVDKVFLNKKSNVLFFVENGFIYTIDYDTGKLIWGPKQGAFKGEPAVLGNTLFVASTEKNGLIYAFQASTGKYFFDWYQHKQIKELFLWNNYLIMRAEDNLGINKLFGYHLK